MGPLQSHPPRISTASSANLGARRPGSHDRFTRRGAWPARDRVGDQTFTTLASESCQRGTSASRALGSSGSSTFEPGSSRACLCIEIKAASRPTAFLLASCRALIVRPAEPCTCVGRVSSLRARVWLLVSDSGSESVVSGRVVLCRGQAGGDRLGGARRADDDGLPDGAAAISESEAVGMVLTHLAVSGCCRPGR